MRLNYTLTVVALVGLMVILLAAKAPEAAPSITTTAAFESGQPVVVLFEYKGGVKNWDGFISADNGSILCANKTFFSLKDSSGKDVKGRLKNVSQGTSYTKPFTAKIDLEKLFDLSEPGKYTLVWGCRNAASSTQTIIIQQERQLIFQLVVSKKTAIKNNFDFKKMDTYFQQFMMSKHLYSTKWDDDRFIIDMAELPSHLRGILSAKLKNDHQKEIAIGDIVDVVNKKVRTP